MIKKTTLIVHETKGKQKKEDYLALSFVIDPKSIKLISFSSSILNLQNKKMYLLKTTFWFKKLKLTSLKCHAQNKNLEKSDAQKNTLQSLWVTAVFMTL